MTPSRGVVAEVPPRGLRGAWRQSSSPMPLRLAASCLHSTGHGARGPELRARGRALRSLRPLPLLCVSRHLEETPRELVLILPPGSIQLRVRPLCTSTALVQVRACCGLSSADCSAERAERSAEIRSLPRFLI